MTIINESGLYSLVLSSKLPTAKKFKRWVTHDVIPSIRKQGYYSLYGTPQETISAIINDIEDEKQRKVIIEAMQMSNIRPTQVIAELLGIRESDVVRCRAISEKSFNNEDARRTICSWKKTYTIKDFPSEWQDKVSVSKAVQTVLKKQPKYSKGAHLVLLGDTYAFDREGYVSVIDQLVKEGFITTEEAEACKLKQRLYKWGTHD